MEFSGQYLTYDEYRLLGGTLDIMPFNLLEYEARKKIDSRTQGRLIKEEIIPQEVKMCMYALMNKINSYVMEAQGNKNISSESVGDYSVNYVSPSELSEIVVSKTKELEDIIMNYLINTIVNKVPLLYLGVC